jgi:TonB family protein
LLAETEKQEILRHEEVHIKKLHSIDIILIQLLGIVFWFNPIVRSYKKSFVQVHEFEADARSVEGHDVDEYCSLLAKVALQNNGYVLANHFTNSFTLKRITMMKTVKRKIKNWKVLAAACTLPLFFFVVACQDQIMNEISDSTLTQVEFPEVVKNDIATKYQAKYPGAKFNYMEGDADEIRTKFATNSAVKQILLNTYPIPNRKTVGVLTVDISNLELKDQNEIYAVVEETAQPKGGMDNFYKYIASNLSYPAEARQKGIQGRVFIEFVVNTDGSISDVRPLKGIGGGCDEEAVRIMAQAEPWNPGKQRGIAVRQRMVIPIIYSLDDNVQPAGKLEEAKQSMRTNGSLIQEGGKYFMIGKVTDQEGQPLLGMNIILAGSTQGTVSDKNGNYKLEVTKETGILVFSFVGFKTETVTF